jgi:hypothetical protein
MYSALLGLHSWLRWAVIILGVLAVVRALGGRGGRPWSSTDDSIGRWFVVVLDVQFVIGLLLYAFVSPLTTQIVFADFGAAMGNSMLRFWAVEHLFGMIVALALAHVGRVKVRNAATDARRHTLAATFFGIALIILLASIPWPGMPAGRPLIRGF